jgi:membrane protein involved in colicin uptake
LDLTRRLSEAPSANAPEERARRRAARASRAGTEAANAARASGAVDIVLSQLRVGRDAPKDILTSLFRA